MGNLAMDNFTTIEQTQLKAAMIKAYAKSLKVRGITDKDIKT